MWHGIFNSCVTGQIRQKSGDIYSTEFWIACNVPWAHETWNFQRIPIQGHWQPVPLHSPADRQISYRWGHRRALWTSLQCWANFSHKYRKQEAKGRICNFIQQYSVDRNHLGMTYIPPACSLWIFLCSGPNRESVSPATRWRHWTHPADFAAVRQGPWCDRFFQFGWNRSHSVIRRNRGEQTNCSQASSWPWRWSMGKYVVMRPGCTNTKIPGLGCFDCYRMYARSLLGPSTILSQ